MPTQPVLSEVAHDETDRATDRDVGAPRHATGPAPEHVAEHVAGHVDLPPTRFPADDPDDDPAHAGGPDALPLPQLAARLCSSAVAISAATAAWLLLIAEFDRRRGWAVPGISSCAHWLAWQCGISPGTARDHVRLARTLPALPHVTQQLATGAISYAKARAIARVADADTEHVLLNLAQHTTAAQLDKIVAGWRRSDDAQTEHARIRSEAAEQQARAQALANGATDDDAETAGREAAAAVWLHAWPDGADPTRPIPHWEQRFDWHDEGDGSVTLRLRLSAEHAAELITAVEHRAEVLTRRERITRNHLHALDNSPDDRPSHDLPFHDVHPDELAPEDRPSEDGTPVNQFPSQIPDDGQPDDEQPVEWSDWVAGDDLPHDRTTDRGDHAATRRARVTVARTTALLDLTRAGLGAVDTHPGDPARREVVVRLDAAVLADDTAAGQAALDGIAALTPAQARRLACDAALTVVLVDGEQVLACGRTRRFATKAQRRALLMRDRGCARPGCTETRPERLHAHHLVSWLAGGRTDIDNLALLCDRCHGLVHDYDLTLQRTPDGRLRARTSAGTPVWTTTEAGPAPRPLPHDSLPTAWRANGERLGIGYAIGVLLDNRAVLRRRHQGTPSAPEAA